MGVRVVRSRGCTNDNTIDSGEDQRDDCSCIARIRKVDFSCPVVWRMGGVGWG